MVFFLNVAENQSCGSSVENIQQFLKLYSGLYIPWSHCRTQTICLPMELVGGWVNQAYNRLSTTHGHITDCKLDSVVYVGVCVVI